MTKIEIAHIREQNQDMIIAFVKPEFAYKTTSDQNGTLRAIEYAAHEAGLKGHAVLVWPGGFLGPRKWHSYFQSVPYNILAANINRELTIN